MYEFDATDYRLSSAGPLSRRMGVYSTESEMDGIGVRILSALRSRFPSLSQTVSFCDPTTGESVYAAVKSRFSRTIRFVRPRMGAEMWSVERVGRAWRMKNPEGHTIGRLHPRADSLTDYARSLTGLVKQYELTAADGTRVAQMERTGSAASNWTVSFRDGIDWDAQFLGGMTPRLAVLSAAALCSGCR